MINPWREPWVPKQLTMLNKATEKEYAQRLFVEDGLTRKAIAQRLNITEKTIGKWVDDGKWEDLKKSILATKEIQITNLYNQLAFLTDKIKNRDEAVADNSEADRIAKITASINKLETDVGLGEIYSVCTKLINYISANNQELAKQIIGYVDSFIKQSLNSR